MVTMTGAFSGFSSDDTDAARTFYSEVMGLEVHDGGMDGLIGLQLPDGGRVLVYPKDDHQPATFTVLNFLVADIDAAVDELVAAGVEMLRYDGMNQDERGIARGMESGDGPDIAWFTDPAGNILAVLTE